MNLNAPFFAASFPGGATSYDGPDILSENYRESVLALLAKPVGVASQDGYLFVRLADHRQVRIADLVDGDVRADVVRFVVAERGALRAFAFNRSSVADLVGSLAADALPVRR